MEDEEPIQAEPFGRIIAERVLQNGDGIDVVIQVGVPTLIEQAASESFECLFRIQGVRDATARGSDSAQALLAALEIIGADLELQNRSGMGLTWHGNTDLGFPLPTQN